MEPVLSNVTGYFLYTEMLCTAYFFSSTSIYALVPSVYSAPWPAQQCVEVTTEPSGRRAQCAGGVSKTQRHHWFEPSGASQCSGCIEDRLWRTDRENESRGGGLSWFLKSMTNTVRDMSASLLVGLFSSTTLVASVTCLLRKYKLIRFECERGLFIIIIIIIRIYAGC